MSGTWIRFPDSLESLASLGRIVGPNLDVVLIDEDHDVRDVLVERPG